MRNYKILLGLFVLMISGITAANAQPAAGSSVKGYIPMSFVVDGKSFSPGRYTIARAQQFGDMSPYVLTIRSDSGDSAVLQTNGTREHMDARDTVLTFTNFEGQHYLTSMTFKGQTRGVEFRNGHRVRQMMARNRSTNETVLSFRDTGE